jgi:hypothetical protein
MKIFAVVIYSTLLSSALSFAPLLAPSPPSSSSFAFTRYAPASTCQHMFGGSGEGMPAEDDPAEAAAMEAAAKQMGIPLDEYKLGMRARNRLMKDLDASRCKAGDTATVAVERDGHNPPKYLEVTITEAGKALGPDQVAKQLVSALKSAGEASKKARADAQMGMMKFITEEMKTAGK